MTLSAVVPSASTSRQALMRLRAAAIITRPGQVLLLGGNHSHRQPIAPVPSSVPAVYRWPAGI